jgi:hypothetical protein
MIQLEIIFMIRFDGFSCELNFDTFQECLCLITDFKSSSFLDKNRVIHRHHIIPKSCGGNNERENLVEVYASQHFNLHHLLSKMFTKGSSEWVCMQMAFNKMKNGHHTPESYELALKNPGIKHTVTDFIYIPPKGTVIPSKHSKYSEHDYNFRIRKWSEKVKNLESVIRVYLKNNPSSSKEFNELYRSEFDRDIPYLAAIFTFMKNEWSRFGSVHRKYHSSHSMSNSLGYTKFCSDEHKSLD